LATPCLPGRNLGSLPLGQERPDSGAHRLRQNLCRRHGSHRRNAGPADDGLQLLYITPLRALSRDIEQSIKTPIEKWGGTFLWSPAPGIPALPAKQAAQKYAQHPHHHPESLSVMLSYKDNAKRFQHLRCVVLDEWHELMSSKRGTQTELSMAYLRSLQPDLRTWAVSATLGNLEEAAQTAVGLGTTPVIIRSNLKRDTVIKSIRPESVDTFPWAGHLGLRMFETLVDALDIEKSTLILPTPATRQSGGTRPSTLPCRTMPTKLPFTTGPLTLRIARPSRRGKNRRHQMGGLHLVPGSGSGFSAGGAGRANRQRQKPGPTAAAGRAFRPCSRRHVGSLLSAHQCPGTAGNFCLSSRSRNRGYGNPPSPAQAL
jgi:hypothetical protein